jgi:hypothetical protein
VRPESGQCFLKIAGHRYCHVVFAVVEFDVHAKVCVAFRLDREKVVVAFESLDEVLEVRGMLVADSEIIHDE